MCDTPDAHPASEMHHADDHTTARDQEAPVSRRTALVAGAGLGLLAVASALPEDAEAVSGYQYAQLGWRYCTKCRSTFYSPKGKSLGLCAAGGKHRPSTPNNYVNYYYLGSQGGSFSQPFNRCTKCTGLYGGTGNVGVCQKGGTHAAGGTPYQIYSGPEYKPMMDGAWDYCSKCRLVYNWAGGGSGVCPAGGGHARSNFSLAFALLY